MGWEKKGERLTMANITLPMYWGHQWFRTRWYGEDGSVLVMR